MPKIQGIGNIDIRCFPLYLKSAATLTLDFNYARPGVLGYQSCVLCIKHPRYNCRYIFRIFRLKLFANM